jgi:hypothetical protein
MPKSKPFPKKIAAGAPSGPANAAHSTGPRTPEDKSRSSQNAHKHGFTGSKFAVVRFEELDVFPHPAKEPGPEGARQGSGWRG